VGFNLLQLNIMAGESDNVVLVGPLTTFQLVFFFIAFTGIALFNGVELLITIFLSFRRQTSCYFFSLLAASCGIIIYQLFVFLMIYGKNMNIYGILTGIDVGWAMMVVGQSMVLWSRLHLVCYNRFILNSILYMIIATGVVCVVVEVVLTMMVSILTPTFIHHAYSGARLSKMVFSTASTSPSLSARRLLSLSSSSRRSSSPEFTSGKPSKSSESVRSSPSATVAEG
jgi:hypothetical protein